MTDQERCDRMDELLEAAANLKAGLEEDGSESKSEERSSTKS